MRLIDPAHPFLRPRWRRIALVAVAFAWAAMEVALGNTLWALLFAAIGGWLAWALILTFPEDRP